MNLHGLSDSLADLSESVRDCERCGALAQIANGLCLRCHLKPALEGEGSNGETFAAALGAIDIHDTDWRLGNYQILEEIGRGGMGVIYRARQRHSRRIVALKRILGHHADSRETLARFRREAEAAASLDHANILPIYEVGEGEDGLPFFSMKYAAGGTLQEIGPALREDPRQIVSLLARVTRAMQCAHDHGILHRDLKPSNILLDGRGEPLVSDFGLAKWLDTSTDLTRTLTIFGTPGYIAPEQARDSRTQLTPAADVYSLGAILFDLLTGQAPFCGEHALAVIQQASEKPAPKLRSLVHGADKDLETICARCLEREPAARYRSAGALADDLERWLEGRSIIARPVLPPARTWRWLKRNPKLAAATIAALVSATTALFLFFSPKPPPQTARPGKSIAVLPFENLSDKENIYFTQGIQDEILTDLATIADLKVISRTSVMQYEPGISRDARAISQALGVNYLIEGSVQRAGGKVRVNAQLINARDDAHVWARTYDGDLADVFIIQSQIAKAIANSLEAKLSPREKAAIERAPTIDLAAFDLYSRAKTLNLSITYSAAHRHALLQAADLLNQAVTRDPSFFQAHCLLADTHTELYLLGIDRTPERLALAEKDLDAAFRLQPDAGEAHLSRAVYLYRVHLDYGGALRELQGARETLPNSPGVFELTGYIRRRQGYVEDSLQNLKRALELDPRNIRILHQIAISYYEMRRYSDVAAAMDRVLAIKPDDIQTQAMRASIELDWKADTRPIHQVIDSIRNHNPAELPTIADTWLMAALAERNPTDAEAALVALGDGIFGTSWIQLSHRFGEGLLARMTNDEPKARAAFMAARVEQEKVVKAQPDYGPAWCALGLIDAGLGKKEEALREGRHATELLPVAKDSVNGAHMIEYFAIIAAWVGEKGLACEQLEKTTQNFGGWLVSYGELKLSPVWDPLRGDARFEKIVASLAPPASVVRETPALPNKSLAALPFENLGDKDTTYLTQGIQDDILTKLAQIGDLKVIGRASVMQYAWGMTRDNRAISRELGATHLLVGSVQRMGDKLRVTAQLIDASNDAQVWTKTYDRPLADVFAIEAEITETVAAQLHTTLSPNERAAVERPPTRDLTAFTLYAQAKELVLKLGLTANTAPSLMQAADLLNQAVARDPEFLLAYCQLASVHDYLYFFGHDHTAARLALADAALKIALRLQPDAGEAHLAQARHYYYGYLKYDAARVEIALAQRTLPNDPLIFQLLAFIDRRQDHWEDAERNLKRSLELDPRNFFILQQLSLLYEKKRRYPEIAAVLDRALSIIPGDIDTRLTRAYVELTCCADTQPLFATIQSILAEKPDDGKELAIRSGMRCGAIRASKKSSPHSRQRIRNRSEVWGAHAPRVLVSAPRRNGLSSLS